MILLSEPSGRLTYDTWSGGVMVTFLHTRSLESLAERHSVDEPLLVSEDK